MHRAIFVGEAAGPARPRRSRVVSERFGLVRGQSPEDACARYSLYALNSGFPAAVVWAPHPLDQRACLARVRRDADTGDWILRFSWRGPMPIGTESPSSPQR